MKRAFIVILLIASIHLALAWYLSVETFSHSLARAIASFPGKAPPDTWFDNSIYVLGKILFLPVGIIFVWLPHTTGNAIGDGIIFWTVMALNSTVWGIAIYFAVRRIAAFVHLRTITS